MSASCPTCGDAIPEGVRFCPHCGSRLTGDETAVIPPPAHEPQPAPVETSRVERRVFGLASAGTLLVVAGAVIVAAVALLALGRLLAALVALAVGAVVLAVAARSSRRLRESALTRAAGSLAESGRASIERASATVRADAAARRRLAGLRAQRERMAAQRRERLLDLGEAVYRGDDEATLSLRNELQALDAALAAREEEMRRVLVEAREQVEQARLATEPTRVVAARDVEPYPSPGEADPPQPARVPEPYPPPGEADPPEQPRQPEPYPGPGEADPPEPARIPEPGPR